MKIQAWIIMDTNGDIVNTAYLSEIEAFADAEQFDELHPEDEPHRVYKITNVRMIADHDEIEQERTCQKCRG